LAVACGRAPKAQAGFCTCQHAARARPSLELYLRRVRVAVRQVERRICPNYGFAWGVRAGWVRDGGEAVLARRSARAMGFGRELYLEEWSPEPPPPSLRRVCPSMRIARIEPSAMPAPTAPPPAPTVQVNALGRSGVLSIDGPSVRNLSGNRGRNKPTTTRSRDERDRNVINSAHLILRIVVMMSAVCVLAASLALHGGSVVRPALLRSPPVAMQLFGRGRAKRSVEAPEQITVGSPLPDVVRLRLHLHRLRFPARVQHTFRRSRASPFGRARSSQLDRLPTPNLTLTLTLPGDRGSSLPAACRYGAGCGAGDGRQGGRAASH
jgi:hypothetical protein